MRASTSRKPCRRRVLVEHLIDRVARVERGVRVLEDHLHAVVEGARALPPERLARDVHLAPPRRHEPAQRAQDGRLAGARLTPPGRTTRRSPPPARHPAPPRRGPRARPNQTSRFWMSMLTARGVPSVGTAEGDSSCAVSPDFALSLRAPAVAAADDVEGGTPDGRSSSGAPAGGGRSVTTDRLRTLRRPRARPDRVRAPPTAPAAHRARAASSAARACRDGWPRAVGPPGRSRPRARRT